MKIIKTETDLKNHIFKFKSQKKSIGFVPTMGALHEGHISLVHTAQKIADICVVSIFVNPTQFDNQEDLAKYPRILDKDAELLEKNKVDILFAPGSEDIYPENLDTKVNLDLNGLDKVMEGEFRDGHFEGVVQVVNRLLDLVSPDYLVMGQKDFQQFTIINHMISTLKLPVKLIIGKTKREEDGLAMSSRNRRLTKTYRNIAPAIHKTLKYLKRNLSKKPISELQEYALKRLTKAGLKPEYFIIFDGNTLQKIEKLENHEFVVAATAAWAGEIRLIDNMPLKKPRKIKYM
jgi:pantoate--beta-alanine ligase